MRCERGIKSLLRGVDIIGAMAEEDLYGIASKYTKEGRRFAVVTVTKAEGATPRGAGAKMLVAEDGSTHGTVGGGALEKVAVSEARLSIRHGESRSVKHSLKEGESDVGMACGGEVELFIEVPPARPRLYIIGAGHIGLALSKLAAMSGFNVTIVDERPELCNSQRFPEAELMCGEVGALVGQVAGSVDAGSYIVIVTHGHRNDHLFLEALVDREVRYLGLIGSRKKISASYSKLASKGVPEERLRSIHAPIGLDIGGDTPEEIAVAILAEMIMVRSGRGTGAELRDLYWSAASDE